MNSSSLYLLRTYSTLIFVLFEQVVSALKVGGAESLNYLDFVTHCILGSNYAESEVADAREIYEIPAVLQTWVSLSVYCNKLLPYPFSRSKLNII